MPAVTIRENSARTIACGRHAVKTLSGAEKPLSQARVPAKIGIGFDFDCDLDFDFGLAVIQAEFGPTSLCRTGPFFNGC